MLNFTPINTVSQGQVQDYENRYGQSQNDYNQNQSQLQDFQKNMVNGTDLYAQQQQAGNKFAGYDPASLQKALSTVQQTQNVISSLPQAINAQNANYGGTASQLAGQYAGLMGNLNPALAAQSNALAKEQATQGAALTYAQQATGAGLQAQQQKLQTLQGIVQNSLQAMDQARQTMTFFEDLYQKQGQFNSAEQAEYQKANAAMLQAQAQANLAAAQARQIEQQITMTQAAADAAKRPYSLTNPTGFKTQGQLNSEAYLNSVKNAAPIKPESANPLGFYGDLLSHLSVQTPFGGFKL